MVFSVEHKTFRIESYFRNGVAIESEWHYYSAAVLQEFQQKFPDFNFIVADCYIVVRNTVRVFRETGSVHHKKVLDDVVYQSSHRRC